MQFFVSLLYSVFVFLKFDRNYNNNMKDLKGKVVWITGASSGIGRELSIAFAKEGAFPVLTARNIENLNQVKKCCLKWTSKCWVQPADLSKTEKLNKLVEDVLENTGGQIDLFVNDAGVSQRSWAKETSVEIDRRIMELDFFSAVTLTKLILPVMLKNKSGHIIVISSISGKFGFPMRTAYTASKHALQGFFESLRTELVNDNINVTIVSPGRIRTDISLHAITKDGLSYKKMDKGQARGMSADLCADKIIKGIKKNKKEILVGGNELLMVYIHRYLPWLYYKIVTRIGN